MQHSQYIIILRGAPGSGKTTIAKYLKQRHYMNMKWEIVSVDDYFTSLSGQYKFNATQVRDAHAWCFSMVCTFLKYGKNIILDNANRQLCEYIRYIRFASDTNVKPIVYRCIDQYTSSKNVPDNIMNNHLCQFQVATPDLLKSLKISHVVEMDTNVRLRTSPGRCEFQLQSR